MTGEPEANFPIADQPETEYLAQGASMLLLFKRGLTADTDAQGAIHIAFGISRSDLAVWEDWLGQLGIAIESRKRWQYGGEALYFRDPDGHLLEVVTPGVWEVY